MIDQRVDNLNITSQQVLTPPEVLKNQLPLSNMVADKVMQARQTIKNILDGKDHRLLVVVGPCSIHDVDAALEYGGKYKIPCIWPCGFILKNPVPL